MLLQLSSRTSKSKGDFEQSQSAANSDTLTSYVPIPTPPPAQPIGPGPAVEIATKRPRSPKAHGPLMLPIRTSRCFGHPAAPTLLPGVSGTLPPGVSPSRTPRITSSEEAARGRDFRKRREYRPPSSFLSNSVTA